jgi:hypothetical protein
MITLVQNRVWVIFDDAPEEFGPEGIVGDVAYASKLDADWKLGQLKADKPYEHQYCTVKGLRILPKKKVKR